MRILLSSLSLLLLLSGCATVDGEPVSSGSVAAGAATWSLRAGHADKKFVNPMDDIRKGIQLGDVALVKKGHAKLAEILGATEMNPFEELVDAYLTLGQGARRRERAHKMASDIVMNELLRPGSTAIPSVEEATRLGLFQPSELFQQPQQLTPTSGGRALLGPITPNAYGPGLNSDATGRSFMWTPQSGGSGYPDPTLRVQPNAYGPGIGMDQYGRPVRPACPPGMLC